MNATTMPSSPHSLFNRQQALFKLMREAKEKKPGYYYQLRLGHNDLVVHEKEPGGYYRPIALQYFCVVEDLPPLGEQKERAPGRLKAPYMKRPNSTPEHADQTANKIVRIEEDDTTPEDTDEAMEDCVESVDSVETAVFSTSEIVVDLSTSSAVKITYSEDKRPTQTCSK